MEKLVITPKTKIYDLLEAYPELEDALIAMAPPFKKLKNPVLRKTVTRMTNLSQAATIGGLKVDEMVNHLRKKAGQEMITAEEGNTNYVTESPAWYDPALIADSIDIRPMLDAGEQPVHEVMAGLKKLKGNEILKVTAPFVPAPLIDKSLSLNYKHWVEKISEDQFQVYFKNE